jgi:hypothetical protein
MSAQASTVKAMIAQVRKDRSCSMPVGEMVTSIGGKAVLTMDHPAEQGVGGARLLAFAIIGRVA